MVICFVLFNKATTKVRYLNYKRIKKAVRRKAKTDTDEDEDEDDMMEDDCGVEVSK